MGHAHRSDGADRQLDGDVTGVTTVVFDAPTARGLTRPSLVCVAGVDLGKVCFLDGGPLTIGRGATDLVLATGDASRRHARITPEGGELVIEDLGSANGTFINGVRVGAPTQLRVGARLQIGGAIFLVVQHDELEQRMQRMQKLEAMGTLAGGIAHDFNNTLAAIVANLDAIEEALPAAATDAQESLRSIWRATSAATALAQRLLRIGRPEPMAFELVPIAELVEQGVGLVRKQAGTTLSIDVRVDGDLAVQGSYEALLQVVENLLLNARDAMPTGGRVSLTATPITFTVGEAFARELPVAGSYVELAIVDQGVGMDAATLARVFEPFFTTKARGKGTGLGMTMVHSTVRGHGGAVDLASTRGIGTTVRVYLQRVR